MADLDKVTRELARSIEREAVQDNMFSERTELDSRVAGALILEALRTVEREARRDALETAETACLAIAEQHLKAACESGKNARNVAFGANRCADTIRVIRELEQSK